MSAWIKVWEPWQNFLQTFPTLAWIWIAMIGACLGSFLNVVVYRMPAGKSLSHPGSHCPRCQHAIRWYDNIPIFGWIWLFGRCRDCRAPIAVRYPLVELLVTGLFAWQWHAHVVLESNEEGPTAASLVSFVWHATWFTTMVAVGLIEADGKPIPIRLLLFPLVVAALLTFFWSAAIPNRTGKLPVGFELVGDGLMGAMAVGVLDLAKRVDRRVRRLPAASTTVDRRGRLGVGVLAAIFLGARTALPIILLATLTEWIVAQRYSRGSERTEPTGQQPSGTRWRWSATLLLLTAIWPLLNQFR